MRKEKLFLLPFLFIMLPGILKAQVHNSVHMHIEQGCYLVIDGMLKNMSGDILNSGTIILSGDYTNNGTFSSGNNSNFKMDGAVQDLNGSNSTTFNNLVIDGSGDKQLSVDARVAGTLDFVNNNIALGNNNLVLTPTAQILNASNTKFVITNGSGSLVKNLMPVSTNFLFPVGSAANNYKPVQLNNSGQADTFSVRVTPGLIPPTSSNNSCVQYTWFITETNAGGSNANLKVGWNTVDEGSLFNRVQGMFWHNIGGVWIVAPGTPGAISNLPLTDWRQQTTITDFSSNANKFILCSGILTDIKEDETVVPGSVSVFPNPTSGNTTFVSSDEIHQIILMDYSGKVISRYENIESNKFVLQASDLATGLYLYTLISKDGEKITGKFVVSR